MKSVFRWQMFAFGCRRQLHSPPYLGEVCQIDGVDLETVFLVRHSSTEQFRNLSIFRTHTLTKPAIPGSESICSAEHRCDQDAVVLHILSACSANHVWVSAACRQKTSSMNTPWSLCFHRHRRYFSQSCRLLRCRDIVVEFLMAY